MEINGYET